MGYLPSVLCVGGSSHAMVLQWQVRLSSPCWKLHHRAEGRVNAHKKTLMNSLYTSFHWNASEHFKMKNHTEITVSLLLKILINDHSLNASKKAINRLFLTTAPGSPSRSTEESASFMEWIKGSSLETCSARMKAEQSLKEEIFFIT